MRKFKHFPKPATCPICKTNQDKACFLKHLAGASRGGPGHGQPVYGAWLIGRANDMVWDQDQRVMLLNLEDSDESHP